jgi:outer membrane assembly lipoprotein YfiO
MSHTRLIASGAVVIAQLAFFTDATAGLNPFAAPSYPTAREQFEYAQALESKGDFKRALDAYQKAVDNFASSPVAAESQFRVAEMLEKTKNYYAAFNAYQAVLDNYPSYPKINLILKRQFKIGNLFLQGKTIGFLKINPSGSYKRAVSVYSKILSNAPFSDLAPNAQYNLGMAYMHKKDYTEASIEFEKIPIRYPHSEFVASAKYQLGVCAYKQASAAPYDQEAAQEAINRLREYTGAHPTDKSVQIAREMLTELEGKKAAALYQIGSFYEKRGSPKASLIYFKEVIRDYPLTRFAEKARKVAAREERKLEAAEAIRQAKDVVDEIERLIEGQSSEIKKIKGKGRKRYQFWKYVIARQLSAEEEKEVAERRQRIVALEGRLAPAELDLREKKEIMANRLRMLNAEAAVERLEDDLHSAQVELQVAQNKLSEIGDLPDAESDVLESAAAEIAGKEELARSKEAELEQLRAGIGKIEEATAAEERRIEEHYQERRKLLAASLEKGGSASPEAGVTRWWRFWKRTAAPGLTATASGNALAPAEGGEETRAAERRTGMRGWFSRMVGRGGRDESRGLERCRSIYKDVEDMLNGADQKRMHGKWDEALENYDRASLKLMELRQVWPDYRRGDVSRLLRACSKGLKDAREESARQQYAELTADLEARLRKNPDDAEARLALGDIRRSHGKTDMAIEEYKKAIELQPSDPRAYYSLGVAAMSKRDFRSAHEAFRKTLDIDPGQPTACHGLGVACKELGDYDGARRGFEEALRLDPSFAPAYFGLGKLYQSALGDRGKAAIYWEKYLELRPDDPQASRIREWIDQERQPGDKAN